MTRAEQTGDMLSFDYSAAGEMAKHHSQERISRPLDALASGPKQTETTQEIQDRIWESTKALGAAMAEQTVIIKSRVLLAEELPADDASHI